MNARFIKRDKVEEKGDMKKKKRRERREESEDEKGKEEEAEGRIRKGRNKEKGQRSIIRM